MVGKVSTTPAIDRRRRAPSTVAEMVSPGRDPMAVKKARLAITGAGSAIVEMEAGRKLINAGRPPVPLPKR